MTENNSSREDPAGEKGPRTITITLPSWSALGAAFLAGVLIISLIAGGVLGYRYLDHRQRLESARNEITALFEKEKAKASSLLEVAGRDASQFRQDLDAAGTATKSSAIPVLDFASREDQLGRDLGTVQKVFSELEDRERSLIDRYHLSPQDTLFSAQNQEEFNALQDRWENLSGQQKQLGSDLRDLAAKRESLAYAEQKAATIASQRKAAQAQAKAKQSRQQQPATQAVFGAPAYYNYSNRYYTAPIYQPNYQPYYYRRSYWGVSYGW